MSNIFDNIIVSFDDSIIHNDIKPEFVNITSKFGVVELYGSKIQEIINNNFEFIFNIDCSGSMSDICTDGRSKQHHINHRLKNMMWFFHDNQNISAYITIFAFDDKIYNIF